MLSKYQDILLHFHGHLGACRVSGVVNATINLVGIFSLAVKYLCKTSSYKCLFHTNMDSVIETLNCSGKFSRGKHYAKSIYFDRFFGKMILRFGQFIYWKG